MGGASDSNLLPPGFHFFPSDEELVVHFLRRKASLLPCQPDIVPTVCMNHHDPWELNGKALEAGSQWYFFSHAKQSRATPNGYWSSVCADETEFSNWVICRVFDSTGGGSQANCHDDEGMELSCLDELFLSLDDYDEVSLSSN
ncbi:NAC domain-containing protein 104 [Zea mays]|uniref:NAC domain-containing protein 104 n=1 Tax=Zea mays TaxID=4577 RepID=A0A3L6FVL2_MAIZE|nr:NAC domain-containing protein 104 [Zea mays]